LNAPASVALAAPYGVASPCGQWPAASSRLVWHADRGAGGRIAMAPEKCISSKAKISVLIGRCEGKKAINCHF
jgi:hypothetical protein